MPIRALALGALTALVCASAVSAETPVADAACPPAGPQPAIADVFAPPSDTLIACIGLRGIDGALFSHWLAAARKGSPSDDDATRGQQVMTFLTSAFWIEGEAAERGVHVSDRAVTRSFNSQRRESFPRLADFHRFLRESGMTRSDLKYRVRVDMLSNRVRRSVLRGHKTPASQGRALDRFVTRFRKRWRARTACRHEYAIDDCGSTF